MNEKKPIPVWDIFVRIFHWMLAVCILVSFLSAESSLTIHIISGCTIITLVAVRIIWGFIGSRHARFSDFIYPPKEVFRYLANLFKRKPDDYIGHNPAGGAMVVTLLIVLLCVTMLGLKTLGEFGKGPFAAKVPAVVYADDYAHPEADEHHHAAAIEKDTHDEHQHAERDGHEGHHHEGGQKFWKEIHEGAAGFLAVLICLHICGVIASSYVHKENLIKAMITGKKYR